jgi:YVTN family beta-propeller protein
MTRSLLLTAALATLTALSGCTRETTCPVGELFCGGACVDLAVDAAHCGACGTACADGSSCRAGACVALGTDRLNCGAVGRACLPGESCLSGACTSLQVACFSVNEVRAVEPLDLVAGSAPRAAGVGPIALATFGADVWSAASISGSLSRLPFDLAAPTEYLLHGNDFEYITSHAGRLLISNAGAGTVVIVDPATGGVTAEIPVGSVAGENIKGIAFAQVNAVDTAFVSLQGDALSGNLALGQKIALLDASHLATCGVSGSPLPCLGAPTYLDVSAGAGPAAGALPFPGRSVTAGGKVYVVLANLKQHCVEDPVTHVVTCSFWSDPGGPGRLAIVDPAGPSVSYFSLSTACGNPGGIALHGATLWVACGDAAAGGIAEVNLAGASLALVAVHPAPVMSPGNVAFCGDHGFVTDQYSGDVYPFDPVNYAASPAAATTVCPASAGPSGYAWAADVTCATRP